MDLMPLPSPIIQPVEGSDTKWRSVKDYGCEFTQDDVKVIIRIAEGFIFDGLTIPRLLWRVVGHPLQGKALPGGFVHDLLYSTALLPRDVADRIFMLILKRNGVPAYKYNIMYRAVRLCGKSRYGNPIRDRNKLKLISITGDNTQTICYKGRVIT